jgi:O-antigen/teichoic acid export membrane protein
MLAQRVFYNTVAQIAGRLVSLALGLLTIRLATGYLGTDGYGRLALIVTISTLIVTIADVGISTILPRELARAPEEVNAIGGAMLRFRLLASGVFVVAAACLVPVLPYDSQVKRGLLLALVGAFFLSVGRFPGAFFQVHLRMHYAAALDAMYRLGVLVFIAAAVVMDLGFYAVVSASVLAGFVWALASFALSRRFWKLNAARGETSSSTLVRDSFAMWAVTVVGLLHFKGDTLLLAAFRSASDVGVYAVAYGFVEQAIFIPGFLMAVVLPILTRQLTLGEREQATAMIQKVFEFLLLLAVAVTLILVIAAEPLVRLVSGDEFGGAVTPLRVSSLAIAPIFASAVFFALLVSLNRQVALLIVAAVSVVANTALNLYFIPAYGATGAAATTVATETLTFAATLVFAHRAFPFSLDLSFLVRITLATGSAVALAFLGTDFGAIVMAAIGSAGFLAAVFATRLVTRSDVRLVLGRSRP